MARVTVNISSASIAKALNTPGGPVWEWRDDTAEQIVRVAKATSPVNSPSNAAHRGGVVGGFRRGFDWEKYGNQHVVGARIYNDALHAFFAELGRRDSYNVQKFSTRTWGAKPHVIKPQPGEISTRGWEGNHTLRDAVNAVMPLATGGSPAGLV